MCGMPSIKVIHYIKLFYDIQRAIYALPQCLTCVSYYK